MPMFLVERSFAERAQLGPEEARVLTGAQLSDLSYAEAAQVCGIDIGTVRSRLHRARAQLATRLGADRSRAQEAVSP